MSDRYFPIHTATACQLKWTWSTVRLYSGTTSSCHRTDSDSFNIDNFDDFHNTEKKIKSRETMLSGQWPGQGCEYCRDIEATGAQSDRLYQLQIPNQYPVELDIDTLAVKVTPRIVEVYLDNVCNMSCIYCWDGYSSKIRQENEKFGPFESNGIVIKNRANLVNDLDALTDRFWQWFLKNGTGLKKLIVLGGEPLYQKQFGVFLEILENHSFPDLEFSIISNLSVDPGYFQRTIERVKNLVARRKLRRFDVTASIDCFGAEQEYVRKGINLSQWKKNFEYLVSQKWIYLSFNQTITSLTIKTMPDLLEYINQLRVMNPGRKINQQLGKVQNYEYLDPGIFGSGFFTDDFDKILDTMPDDEWQYQQSKQYMKGIFDQINSNQKQSEKIDQLITYLTELDRRRGTDWKKVFPWLEKEMVTNVV